jgi:hypothetical protein
MMVSTLLMHFVDELRARPDVQLEDICLALIFATVIAIVIRVASKLMNSSTPFYVSLQALIQLLQLLFASICFSCYLLHAP